MTTNTSERELETLSPNGPSSETSVPSEAQLPHESGEEEPIDGDGLILDNMDNMDDGSYDASQSLEEEPTMESEVTA